MKTRIDQLNDEAWTLLHLDSRRCAQLAEEAGQLARSTTPSYAYGLGFSLLIRSILAWDRAEYQPALAMALEAANLFEAAGDVSKLAYTINHIAGIHYFLGNSALALEQGYRAQRLAERSNDRWLLAAVLNDTGYMLLHLGDQETALDQLQRSLTLHRQLNSKHGEAQALDSIAAAYLLQGKLDQALAFEEQSLALDREIGYPRAEVEALGNIGKIHRAAGRSETALKYFSEALTLAHQRGYQQFEATLLLESGRIHLDGGDPLKALELLNQARQVAETIGSKPVLADIHEALATVHEQRGDWQASLAHYRHFHAIKESSTHELTMLRLDMMAATYEAETARQEAEISRLRNVELRREIEERETAIAELDAFAHTVAHDLKNPLAAVYSMTLLLAEETAAILPPEMKKLLQHLEQASLKSMRIIDDLLLLARVRHEADLQIVPLDMAAIVNSAETRLASIITEHQATIEKPDHWPVALGYGPWVEAIWTNYLSNAIKYGGSPPRITLGAQHEDAMLRFWVRDNGMGIAAEDQELLFVEFSRVPTVSNRIAGHGLGLSIVKRIVDRLGGSVGVESTPGRGSTFSFTLPVDADGSTASSSS